MFHVCNLCLDTDISFSFFFHGEDVKRYLVRRWGEGIIQLLNLPHTRMLNIGCSYCYDMSWGYFSNWVLGQIKIVIQDKFK